MPFILMYHRVCTASPSTAAYFARGTAVDQEVFARQVAWLAERYQLVSLVEALTMPDRDDRVEVVALTFDDGYSDVLHTALPVCRAHDAPLAVFPVAGHLADARAAIWFDAYYDLLHKARTREPIDHTALGLGPSGHAPPPGADLTWWVRGPFKKHLQAMAPGARDRVLEGLAVILDAIPTPALAPELYLSFDQLADLALEGHLVGGHGRTHSRLDASTIPLVGDELAASVSLLDQLGISSPRVFCYPDGGVDSTAEALVGAAGFAWALTVDPGRHVPAGNRYRVPRLLMRNVLPGAPGWPSSLS